MGITPHAVCGQPLVDLRLLFETILCSSICTEDPAWLQLTLLWLIVFTLGTEVYTEDQPCAIDTTAKVLHCQIEKLRAEVR